MTDKSTSYIRWGLISWLFVLSAVAFLDRVNISIAGPLLGEAYKLNNVQLGYVYSSFLWGYAIFQTPGGRLADRFGPRIILLLGVIWWGIFSILTASVPTGLRFSVLLLIVIRFALGAGEAVIYPASNQFVSRWIPAGERGVANGLIFAGVGAGAGLTPPLIAFVIFHYGWRMSFVVCAAIGLLAGLVWYFISRDTPAAHPKVSRRELDLIQSGLPIQTKAPGKDKLLPWSVVLKSKDVVAVTLSYFSFGYVAWIFFSWFFTYLKQVRGLDLKSSALYSMLPFIAMALTSPLGGLLTDRLTKKFGPRIGRCWVAAAAIASTAVFLALGAHAENARIASLVLAGGAGALYVSQSCFWSVTTDLAGTSSGSVSGFMNMGAQIGGALTAIMTPLIAQHYGWTVPFYVAAVLCILGAAAWLLVDPARKLSNPTTAA